MDMNVNPPPALDDPRQRALIEAIANGLPLVARPYAEIGRRLGVSEHEVMTCMRALQEQGLIKRLGVVVRHRELGYTANAMVVWDIPDAAVREIGSRFGRFAFVTLCYRRPRRLPSWPYNLFTMIHGRDRAAVLQCIQELIRQCDLTGVSYDVLFSRRRFKQRGARYALNASAAKRAVA
jgi:DNA-binding Lrp family transcriptional regulator